MITSLYSPERRLWENEAEVHSNNVILDFNKWCSLVPGLHTVPRLQDHGDCAVFLITNYHGNWMIRKGL